MNPNKLTGEKIYNQKGRMKEWTDYRWHLRHTIKDIQTFEQVTGIELKNREEIKRTLSKFPLSITPYYLSLMDKENYELDPIFRQSFPDPKELVLTAEDMQDPLHEENDSLVENITHRYPDRVLFTISGKCAMYCRYCTRKRKVGDRDYIPTKEQLEKGIEYIKNTEEVRDVLLSGGDPLMLSDEYLDWILGKIKEIPHVQVIRLGTKTPAVLPFRITDNLIEILKKYQPLWINTHFNHPREITSSARKCLNKLADAGFPLGNQSVLLAGVNDCPRIIKTLMHKLVANRVRPYYLYQCDLSEGLAHFRTPVSKGLEIMEYLRGHTSGFAVPNYVIDAPGGGGKIPINPNYIISWATNKVILRNYEGVIATYKEPDSYEPVFCDRKCDKCKLQLKLEGARAHKPHGLVKLLSYYDKTYTLTPGDNERGKRTSK